MVVVEMKEWVRRFPQNYYNLFKLCTLIFTYFQNNPFKRVILKIIYVVLKRAIVVGLFKPSLSNISLGSSSWVGTVAIRTECSLAVILEACRISWNSSLPQCWSTCPSTQGDVVFPEYLRRRPRLCLLRRRW